MQAGDQVEFYAISEDEYHALVQTAEESA